MESDYFTELETDARLSAFVPENREATMSYAGLRCPCGGFQFRLSGWLAVATGRGGFFWRSVARAWREARQSMAGGESADSPIKFPIWTRCDRCTRAGSILDLQALLERLPESQRNDPMESLRCRVCRRGQFEIVVGVDVDVDVGDGGESAGSLRAVEVITRCHACHREERLAWSKTRLSDQEIRLDLLYGRR